MNADHAVQQEIIGAKHETLARTWPAESGTKARELYDYICSQDRGVWPYKYKYKLVVTDMAGGWVVFDSLTSNFDYNAGRP